LQILGEIKRKMITAENICERLETENGKEKSVLKNVVGKKSALSMHDLM
jgi:hypothetical protein